ncbi:hypothetical protein Gogos_012460 [Gossypium gossypioides]|uniref:Auxin-responsive protein SAUR64-like n=1 Tax=Gossypium gossypioides TaxID=34282 RepID=A0A7J9BSP3_GOSGO|nr:hypothetical protein [Gossypium gossypioides]
MARKWQKLAAIGRRITSSLVDKGHFVIYTIDQKRFVMPLAYLRNTIFVELLKMSEEEFGLPSDGTITLPCDSVAMNYILSLLQRSLAKYLEKAVLNSVASNRCSSNTSYCHQAHTDQQSLKIASIGRKRIASARTNTKIAAAAANDYNRSSEVVKGCFVIFTMDKRRFLIPLAFLSICIFRELFKLSEEEFGLPSDGPITFPCDTVFMNYIVFIVKRGLSKDLERSVVNSISTYHCSSDTYFNQGHEYPKSLICEF